MGHEPGYVLIRYEALLLLKALPEYFRITNGSCQDHGLFPITDLHTCEMAAKRLGRKDIQAHGTSYTPSPEGCFLSGGKTLFFSNLSANVGNGAIDIREPICSSSTLPRSKCTPITRDKTIIKRATA